MLVTRVLFSSHLFTDLAKLKGGASVNNRIDCFKQ